VPGHSAGLRLIFLALEICPVFTFSLDYWLAGWAPFRRDIFILKWIAAPGAFEFINPVDECR